MMNDKYVALDLFSGTGSATKPFRESDDWIVVGIDIDPDMPEDEEMNVLDLTPDQVQADVDFIWASPPCKSFSIANIYNNWTAKNERLRMPKSEKALKGVELVYHTLYIIQKLNPVYWYMENPRGGLRKIIGEPQHDKRRELDKDLNVAEQKDKVYPGTVTYCQFGDDRMKPTDLWGSHPEDMEYPFCGNGQSCHESAERGSRKGTQGKNKGAERWRVPEGLARHVFEVVDRGVRKEVEQ